MIDKKLCPLTKLELGCTPDCAWAMKGHLSYCCTVPGKLSLLLEEVEQYGFVPERITKVTNYEKYFGSSEKVAKVFEDLDAWETNSTKQGFIEALFEDGAEYALCHTDTMYSWLRSEANE